MTDKPLSEISDDELSQEVERRRIAATTSSTATPPNNRPAAVRPAKDWTPEEANAFRRQHNIRR